MSNGGYVIRHDSSKMDRLLLELRNAIADKEWIIATANRDIAMGGEWRCDWSDSLAGVDTEIQDIIEEIKKLGDKP
jgi:ACT domain-containing protein